MMNNEAYFNLTDAVNKENWALSSDNPQIHEKTLHDLRVTVWVGVNVWG